MVPTSEDHIKLILIQWTLIIVAAWIFGRLGKRFGQPLAVGEILAGILLGPSVLGALWPGHWPALFPLEIQPTMHSLGKLGLIFLLFQVGMEFDYSHIRPRSGTIAAVSVLGIVAPCLCALMIGPWLHKHFASTTPFWGFQSFLCITLSISALPIMGRILLEMKLEHTAVGAMSISAAAIDDVIGWILLGLASAAAVSHCDPWFLFLQIAGLLVFFFVLQKIVSPWLRQEWKKQSSLSSSGKMPASFLALLLIGLFISALITHVLGVFVIFGAFLFGVCLHQETSLVKAWRDQFANIVLVAFVPVFFTNTGLNTHIGSLNSPTAWIGCALILVAAVAGKFGGCYLGSHLTGQPSHISGPIAALMNTRALMALVAINIGLELKLITPAIFTMLVIMALVTTVMCAPLLRCWITDQHSKES